MIIAGTVINGVIVPDGNEILTEGTRVSIEVTDTDLPEQYTFRTLFREYRTRHRHENNH
jgi:hypothetical protein